jgi:Domain of unknown function (DUF4333)
MSHKGRLAALAFALALVLALAAGCGKTVIDDVKTEEALQQNVEDSLGQKVRSVECPSGVEVEAKATFECTIDMVKGDDQTATLRIRNDDADVEVVELRSGDVDLSVGG